MSTLTEYLNPPLAAYCPESADEPRPDPPVKIKMFGAAKGYVVGYIIAFVICLVLYFGLEVLIGIIKSSRGEQD